MTDLDLTRLGMLLAYLDCQCVVKGLCKLMWLGTAAGIDYKAADVVENLCRKL
jgi:hypothetical protein